MRAIELCRTAALGGHVEECDHCGALRISYNSCRNRHCPKCQCLDKERWLEGRKKDLLPTQYFHLVFTISESLRPLALRNQNALYSLLFRAASETLKELKADPKYLGAEVGFIAILHTWSQTLMDHPHLHCIVTGGGLSPDGKKWIPCKKHFFFIPVKVLSRLFQGKFLAYLKEAKEKGKLAFPGNLAHLKEDHSFKTIIHDLYERQWVVYCKPPFSSAETVMDYLGRYTHRVAISNDRLIRMQEDQVTFRYRDRKQNASIKLMSLHAAEFIRRFLYNVSFRCLMNLNKISLLSMVGYYGDVIP
ncbi:MAG: IS91 family transposase [Deltaproteobacteria bacterium]|nr:IS91 family transposase [Deltaproteobacteria bacterium]